MRYLGGKVLFQQRKRLGLSLATVAREVCNRGHSVTDTTIRNYELCETVPGVDVLPILAEVLQMTLADLFGK